MAKTSEKGYFQKLRGLSLLQKSSLFVVLFVLFYTLAGFLAAPPLLKLLLERKIPETLHRSASIDKIQLNPYTLTATIENFVLLQKSTSDTFISFDRLFVNLQLSSLFKRALVIQSLQLTGPTVNFARLNKEEYSFSDLLTEKETEKTSGSLDKPFLFSINNVEVANGAVSFHDGPKEKTHLLSSLNLAVPTISNLPVDIDTHVQPAFSAKINGKDLSLGGTSKPFAHSRESAFDLKLSKLNIPEYHAYIPNPTEARLKSGTLDLDIQLAYVGTPEAPRFSVSGLLSVNNLALADDHGTGFARIPKIDIQIEASNLLKQDFVLQSVNIIKPEVNFIRQTDETIMPVYLFTPEEKVPPLPSEESNDTSNPRSFTVEKIAITDGTISFLDQTVENFQTSLSPLDLTLTNFSTKGQTIADFLLQFKSESNEDIKVQGQTGLNPLVVDGNIDLKELNLVKYSPYISEFINPEIKGGSINLSSNFHLKKNGDESQTIFDNTTMQLSELLLSNDSENLIDLPLLSLSNTKIDVEEQKFTIGELNSQSAKILIKRNKEGDINLAKILKEAEKKEPLPEDGENEKDDSRAKIPWIVTLNSGNIEKYQISFTDSVPDTPFTTHLSELSFHLANVSTTKNSAGDISFSLKVDDNGTLSGKGSVAISPLLADLSLEGDSIDLLPLQSYAADHAQIFITDGTISAAGDLKISQEELISAHFQGRSQVDDLTIADASGEDLIRWKGFSLAGIEFSSKPQTLAIEELDWKDPFLHLVILKDGRLNIHEALKIDPGKADTEKDSSIPSAQDEAAEKEKPEALKITVDNVTLSGGKLQFQDQKISPAYAATLDNFGGTVTGLSTDKERLAEVNFKGRINQQAPVTVTGKINPLREDLFADLKLDFQNIDLSSASPYTGKFIGYKTKKGKLNLDLYYNINGKDLKAKNKVYLNQFTLGEFVESMDAVSLPIHLAIALLKNRRGEIFLDIPVEGNLADPAFSVTSVVFKVIFNLITKAATSPFALLGALIPNSEDMQYISFPPGVADLDQNAAEKLTKMASVLYERPGLRMDIQGHSSHGDDLHGLVMLRLKQQVRLEKIKEQQSVKKTDKPGDSITVSPEEYPRYLALAYQASLSSNSVKKDPSDQNIGTRNGRKEILPNSSTTTAGQAKMSVEFMETELLKKITVSEEDLRLLAIQRATNVLDFLVEKGSVESERLFLIEPNMISEKKNEKNGPATRVDLIIK